MNLMPTQASTSPFKGPFNGTYYATGSLGEVHTYKVKSTLTSLSPKVVNIF